MRNMLREAQRVLETMRSLRRDFHRHPELGMNETRTAEIIARRLQSLGMEVQTGIGGTGVVGLLCGSRGGGKTGGKAGKTVALRADIDALPMQDLKKVDYASENAGVAHSCGHDAHIAIQLGAAEILSGMRDELTGNVKFIFQPSEDTLPGGAVPMIEDGVMDNPPFQAIFTLHLMAHFTDGTVAVKPGNASTSSVSFTLTISGTGGHVGSPHKVVNPVLLAGTVIIATENILPKKIEPGDPMILEFTAIHGGTVGNIVPGEVTLKGSIRVSSPEKRDMMTDYFENMIRGIVEPAGGRYTLLAEHGYPTIYNHPDLIPLWQEAAAKIVGDENVILHDQIIPVGDDAAFFQQKVPGVYWMLGIRNEEKGFIQPLHSPRFDFNEDVLAIGAAVQAQAVVDYFARD